MATTFALDIWVMPLGTLFYTWNFNTFIVENGETVDYFFKTESKSDLSYITVRGVAIRYVNLGSCPLTVILNGMFTTLSRTLNLGQLDPTGTGNAIKNKEYYGAPSPLGIADGKSYTAYFYFGSDFTDEDFQVQLHMVGDGFSQFKIEQVSVIGDSEEISK